MVRATLSSMSTERFEERFATNHHRK
jgi:hypothetical protein